MTPITAEEFDWLLVSFQRDAVHLETRDVYGREATLPHRPGWTGSSADLEWLRRWCDTVSAAVKAGKSVRRVRIVSEPLSAYQRESFGIVPPMVVAGEGIRWLPRRAASSLAVPGNDFYLFDGRLIVFLLYSGDGTATERLVSGDPAEIALCRTAFESAWEQAIPHAGYRPT